MAAPRIAYFTDEELPNCDASAIQIVHTLSALARLGATVKMYFPVRPSASRDPEWWRNTLRAHFGAEVGFDLCPLPTRSGPRIWIKTAEAMAATALLLRDDCDVVYTRNLLPIVPSLAAGRDVVFETYRPLTRQFPASAPLFNGVARSSHFLGIVTHSKFTRDAFIASGLPAQKVEAIYNGFDAQAFSQPLTPQAARLSLGLPERKTVVYTGRIAAVKNSDLLLDAAAAVPEAQWLIAGAHDTEEARPYAERARDMPHVRLLGYVSGERLTQTLAAADVLVIPPSLDPLERFGTTVLPIKLFTYLAAGRAIVAGNLPDARELLTHEENALLVPPDELLPFVAAIRRALTDATLAATLGAACRLTAEDLTWDARARRLMAFIEGRRAARPL